MTIPELPIAQKLSPCLAIALQTPANAAACRQRLESIPEGDLAGGLVNLFQGPWKLTAPQVAEMQLWPRPQLELLLVAAIVAARTVEQSGVPMQALCVGRAGVPRSLSVGLVEGMLLVEFVGPNLV
jgi:hypothetical protein